MTLSAAEQHALAILSDRVPHRTWGRATDHLMQAWDRVERGILNANVASRLQSKGMAEYRHCECCGAGLGVAITDAGRAWLGGARP